MRMIVTGVAASIGGYMGLCLGASILTLFELFELVLDYCAQCHHKKKPTRAAEVTTGTDNPDPDKTTNDEMKPRDRPKFADFTN